MLRINREIDKTLFSFEFFFQINLSSLLPATNAIIKNNQPPGTYKSSPQIKPTRGSSVTRFLSLAHISSEIIVIALKIKLIPKLADRACSKNQLELANSKVPSSATRFEYQ